VTASKRERAAAARIRSSRAKWKNVKFRDNRDPDTVKAEGKMGGGDCWCGQRSGHDWPGKSDGKPHPR
jgi:hypothetical protein